METVVVPKREFIQMKQEIDTLRKSDLYRRLLQFEQNIREGKMYTRKDLGF